MRCCSCSIPGKMLEFPDEMRWSHCTVMQLSHPSPKSCDDLLLITESTFLLSMILTSLWAHLFVFSYFFYATNSWSGKDMENSCLISDYKDGKTIRKSEVVRPWMIDFLWHSLWDRYDYKSLLPSPLSPSLLLLTFVFLLAPQSFWPQDSSYIALKLFVHVA